MSNDVEPDSDFTNNHESNAGSYQSKERNGAPTCDLNDYYHYSSVSPSLCATSNVCSDMQCVENEIDADELTCSIPKILPHANDEMKNNLTLIKDTLLSDKNVNFPSNEDSASFGNAHHPLPTHKKYFY